MNIPRLLTHHGVSLSERWGKSIFQACATFLWFHVVLEPEKKFNGIGTQDLCDTGAVLYQLSYQANRGVTMFESRSGLNIFQALISQLLKLCV